MFKYISKFSGYRDWFHSRLLLKTKKWLNRPNIQEALPWPIRTSKRFALIKWKLDRFSTMPWPQKYAV